MGAPKANPFEVRVEKDLEDLIPGFLANRKNDLDQMFQALRSTDWPTLQRVAHSLKGVGGGYGFDQISEMGVRLEVCAKSKDLKMITQLLNEMQEFLENVQIQYF